MKLRVVDTDGNLIFDLSRIALLMFPSIGEVIVLDDTVRRYVTRIEWRFDLKEVLIFTVREDSIGKDDHV